jgi:hypothetical protein
MFVVSGSEVSLPQSMPAREHLINSRELRLHVGRNLEREQHFDPGRFGQVNLFERAEDAILIYGRHAFHALFLAREELGHNPNMAGRVSALLPG